MRRLTCGALLAGVVLVGSTACGSGGITARRVNAAVGPTFANLYVVQQAQHGLRVTASSLRSKATCTRGDQSTPDKGPGEDWVCSIQWFKRGPAIPVAASYSLHVQANGCYTAEGDGPPDVNGQPTVITPSGDPVVNPLYKFDGCFDTT